MRFHSSTLFFILMGACLPLSLLALPEFKAYTDGHADIGVRLVNGELEGFWENDSITVDGVEITDSNRNFSVLEVRALGIFDANTPPPNRPAGTQWAFLGVGPGEPIYNIPSSNTTTLPFLGFSAEDPSLTSIAGLHRVRVTLVDMVGPPDGVFNLYTSPSAIFMSTFNGIDANDRIFLGLGDHLHYAWAFSQLGVYDLFLRFDALDASDNVLLSVTESFRFHITDGGGYPTYEDWRRTFFRLEDLSNDEISGPMADPVGNGRTNLERYVFGKNPVWNFDWVEDGEEVFPGVRVRVREGSDDLNLGVEFSTTLAAESWTTNGLIEVSRERIFHFPGLEERVYRLEESPGPRAFFRTRVEWDDE